MKAKVIIVAIVIIAIFIGLPIFLYCSSGTYKISYAVTFSNGDQDTIKYSGAYSTEFLSHGDLIINKNLGKETIAADVRTYKIISFVEQKEK